MNVLVIDVGGTHIKLRIWGTRRQHKFPSGKKMSASHMALTILELTKDWSYDVVSIGLPVPVVQGRIVHDPKNLGSGWVGFDFAKA